MSRRQTPLDCRPFAHGPTHCQVDPALRVRRGAVFSAPTTLRRRSQRSGAPDFFGCRRCTASRFRHSAALTDEIQETVSDLQFTARYRVPFQFSRLVREHLRGGAFLPVLFGTTVTDLDGNPLFRSERLVRCESVRLRLLQGMHRARQRARSRPRPVLGAYHPVMGLQRTSVCARSPVTTKCSMHMSGTER